MTAAVPYAWRELGMPLIDDLALFLGGSGDSFTGDLLRLMCKADPGNQRKLADAFPREAVALLLWQRHAPLTFGQLADLIETVPPFILGGAR